MLNDKIKGSGIFFRDILRNFILLLLAPMITILLIFSQADRTVKSQVLESASKTFTLYYEQMDEVMVGMRNTCTTIYANEKCQLYSRESVGNSGMADSLNYDIYQILQNLSEVAYHDIFIYYYRNNKIISGIYTSLTAEQYYDSYYGKLGEEGYREEFLEIIKSDSKRPTCHVIKNVDGKPYLCMTLGVRSQRLPKSNYTICVDSETDLLEKNGISFPFQKLWVCILQLEMVGVEIEDDLTCFIIHNVIEELGNNIGKAYFVELTKTRYVLITNTEEGVDALSWVEAMMGSRRVSGTMPQWAVFS